MDADALLDCCLAVARSHSCPGFPVASVSSSYPLNTEAQSGVFLLYACNGSRCGSGPFHRQTVGMARRPTLPLRLGPASFQPALVRQADEDRIQRPRLQPGALADLIAIVPGGRLLQQQQQDPERL